MPFIKVYIHFVWSTKSRVPYLNSQEIRKTVWNHILENGKKKDIFIDQVNGHKDHCHCLVSLSWNQTMSEVMQLIKGESAHWINKQKLINEHFGWQDEYYAVSVSESILPKVRRYIQNQEEHHKRKTYADELDELCKIYGFKMIDDK